MQESSENSPVKRKNSFDESNNCDAGKCKREELAEEDYFVKLFHTAQDWFSKLLKLDDECISNAIQSHIDSWRLADSRFFREVKFYKAENVAAYLYRYAPTFAGAVNFRVGEALKNCDELRACLRRPEVNVVSLGGGPGTDAIGLCSALYDYAYFQSLNLTIVDNVQRWSSCFSLLEFLIREGFHGKVSKLFKTIDVSTSFIRANIVGSTERNSGNTRHIRTLKEADIVVMSKFLSVLQQNERIPVVTNTWESMKPGALLLYIDAPFYASSIEGFNVIYRSNEEPYLFPHILNETKFGHNISQETKTVLLVLRKPLSENISV